MADKPTLREDVNEIQTSVNPSLDNTAQRKTEEELVESEEKYRLLAENVTDIIWTMDMDMKFTYYSPSVTRLQGFTVEEALARSVENSMTPESFKLVTETMAEELEKHHKGLKPIDRSRKLELELFCKDTSTIWAEVEANFIYDSNNNPEGIIGVTRDITARKKAEEELRNSKSQFRLFIDSSPDLCFLKDMEGRYILVNKANAEFFGKKESEIIGKTDFDLMPIEVARECNESDTKAVNEKRMVITIEHVDDRVYETRKIPVISNNQVVSIAGIIRDITEEKRLQKQLGHAYKMEAIGTLTGGVAHDFNNILGIIIGNTELAMEDVPKWNPAYF